MLQGLPTLDELSGRRAQIFPTLTGAQIARITPFGVEQTFPAGHILFEQGDSHVPFFVVLEGELEVVHPRGKFEDLVTVQGPREFTGEVTLLTDRRALVRGRAKGALRVLRVEHARLRSLIQTDPELSELFLRA